MMMYLYSFISIFFSSLFVFVSNYKHFLLMLLSLESLVLSLYILLFVYFSQYIYECFLVMVYLTMSVCESALGLSLLVYVIRTHGSDMILVFDSLW